MAKSGKFNSEARSLKAQYEAGVKDGRIFPLTGDDNTITVLVAASIDDDIAQFVCREVKGNDIYYYRAQGPLHRVTEDVEKIVLLYNRYSIEIANLPPEAREGLTHEDIHNLMRIRSMAQTCIDVVAKVTGIHLGEGFSLDQYQAENFELQLQTEVSHANHPKSRIKNAMDDLYEQRDDMLDKKGGRVLARNDHFSFDDKASEIALREILSMVNKPGLRN